MLVAVEILRIVHEEIADAAMQAAAGDGRKAQAQALRDGHAGQRYGIDFDAAVPGQEYGDFMAEFDQRAWQSLNHICQPTGFCVRKSFRRYEQYAHVLDEFLTLSEDGAVVKFGLAQ